MIPLPMEWVKLHHVGDAAKNGYEVGAGGGARRGVVVEMVNELLNGDPCLVGVAPKRGRPPARCSAARSSAGIGRWQDMASLAWQWFCQ
jgi:hypothetical protein